MAFQGMFVNVEGHAMKVAFPFGGRTHEVHLPPCPWYQPGSDEARLALQGQAAIVLQCLTSRVALELQAAIHGSGDSALVHTPRLEVPSIAREMHGSFTDLVQQLQDCVQWCHQEDHRGLTPCRGQTANAGLLRAAAALGHASAAQQLLLIDPSAGTDELDDGAWSPAHLAVSSAHSAAVLQMVLQAAPDQLLAVCQHSNGCSHWTLMHSAAHWGNAEAIRLLLQLAPELANAECGFGQVPLHEAAASGNPEAVRLLLEAAPQLVAATTSWNGTPLHWAADGGNVECLRILLEAGAPGLDAPDESGDLPLHCAAGLGNEAAVRFLLAAHPAAALAENDEGHRPLEIALDYVDYEAWRAPPVAVNAVRALLTVSGLSMQQLMGLLAAVPADGQPLAQLLYADLAAHIPLNREQWEQVPTPCPGLGRALPAVLARSEAEAALMVAHLPPADTERLRVAALSLHRAQRALQLDVPPALLGRMLSLALSLSDS